MSDIAAEKPRVLLVDDDADILAELSEGLTALGLPNLTAATPVAAIDLVQRNEDLQVVVTDLQMPRIDGMELLQKLALLRRKRPLATIIITGHASLDRAVGALRLNAVDFLQKPVLAEEVAQAVRRAMALVEDAQRNAGNAAAQAASASKLPMAAGPNYLKALVAARADREAIFKSDLFSDPAWEMLLDLAVAQASGRPISVTSLCIASGAPTTTALRRIDELKEAGLIERRPDPQDRRRIIVELTEGGRARMDAFVKRQAERLGLPLD
ncbi:response regulator [Prosthecomicrobium pneumaticum]|uniref:FixJ family two-component response regulator/DNA-binding MarR family transcriptional regulator n=1 Tax=Prosthecomicrobium pneumaticum TaxID=81895 RepID=A0A7W9CSQ5_9HYPH|nr:response regulator [Prosthecomicrobium pneumaticum]MBB5751006.1 FixJ family two-component response regulator/DNA-binding MarR family transcriptional regulator [Prosthecomicrobium pneumaticum]